MNKYHWIVIVAIISLLLEIGVLGRFFAPYRLTIFIPLMLIVAASFKIEEGLIVALACGFLLDLSTLSRLPFWSVFLTAEVLAISYAQTKLINLKNNLTLILSALIFNLLGFAIQSIIFTNKIFGLQFLGSVLSNFLLSSIILISWFYLAKRQGFVKK